MGDNSLVEHREQIRYTAVKSGRDHNRLSRLEGTSKFCANRWEGEYVLKSKKVRKSFERLNTKQYSEDVLAVF